MKLAYDIARCGNYDCDLKIDCARWMVPGRPEGNQVYSMFPGGEDCEYHIPYEEYDNALSD